MQFTASVRKHTLNFHFSAGTSRGVLHNKQSWFLKLDCNGRYGVGEASTLAGLSPEGTDLDPYWPSIIERLKRLKAPATEKEVFSLAEQLGQGIASIQFAIETALLDWLSGGNRILYANSFSAGVSAIPINGLIWMADHDTMKARIDEKIALGFNCLKMKIGAIDFKEELDLLAYIRSMYKPDELILRVDANGAFSPGEALEKLHSLAEWDIHSIEQPIKAGQPEAMRSLCAASPIPIALDEELIGHTTSAKRKTLLDSLMPQYIILKPSLLGGLAATTGWIQLAEERAIGWWITSALESNVGLNAIAQFTATYAPLLPQGLGTGQLYTNNVPSPLQLAEGQLRNNPRQPWDFSVLGW